jgi:hypothetical protein
MNISSWSDSQIMMLPDHMFGRRWVINITKTISAAGTTFGIAEAALPERTVLWELILIGGSWGAGRCDVSIALGDKLPGAGAEFGEMEPLYSTLEYLTGTQNWFLKGYAETLHLNRLRTLIPSRGRRFVAYFWNQSTSELTMTIYFVVSSVPTEIPEWYRSDRQEGR